MPSMSPTERELCTDFGVKRYLNTRQLAEVLNYSNSKCVLEARRTKRLPVPTMRMGGEVVAEVRTVAAYLDRLRAQGAFVASQRHLHAV